MDEYFVKEMMKIGIVSYRDQETLWEMGKRCAKTYGITAAGAFAVYGAPLGPVGMVEGALAGLFYGTVSCVMLNKSVQDQLKEIVGVE